MTRQKVKQKVYNDGVLYVCSLPEKMSSFSAVKNAITKNELHKEVRLPYCEVYKRDSDMAFAESQGRQLSIKVRTPAHYAAEATKYALIGSMLYSIIKLDVDKTNHELYFYLEEVRKLT